MILVIKLSIKVSERKSIKKHRAETGVLVGLEAEVPSELFPEEQEVFLENCHKEIVGVAPIAIMVALAVAFLAVTTLFHTPFAPLVEIVHNRTDLAEVQGVECILKQKHLGFCAIAFVPTLLLADK